MRKNRNRGSQKLNVWNDAKNYFALTYDVFEKLDSLAYKLENGLLKLVESLERKRSRGDWIDHLIVKESNAVYGNN